MLNSSIINIDDESPTVSLPEKINSRAAQNIPTPTRWTPYERDG